MALGMKLKDTNFVKKSIGDVEGTMVENILHIIYCLIMKGIRDIEKANFFKNVLRQQVVPNKLMFSICEE